MGCFEAFSMAWRKAFVYSGRARRKEYVCFFFINLVAVFALAIFDMLTGNLDAQSGRSVSASLYGLAAFIANLSLIVRRFHDINWSGLWLVGMFIPFLNFFLWLYLLFEDGTHGRNRYGPDPKGR